MGKETSNSVSAQKNKPTTKNNNNNNNINNKKAKASTTFAGTREFRGFRRATSGSGGDLSPGSAASLPVASLPAASLSAASLRRRHFRRRHIRFSQTTPMYRGGVCDAIASGFSADAKSR